MDEMSRLTMEIVSQALFSTQVGGDGNAISGAITTLLSVRWCCNGSYRR